MDKTEIEEKLEYLRGKIVLENISYDEIAELQSLIPHIENNDTLLLEWAGVPEFPEKDVTPIDDLRFGFKILKSGVVKSHGQGFNINFVKLQLIDAIIKNKSKLWKQSYQCICDIINAKSGYESEMIFNVMPGDLFCQVWLVPCNSSEVIHV